MKSVFDKIVIEPTRRESLTWRPVKFYVENGEKYKIVANISLEDLHNKHCDFHITANVYVHSDELYCGEPWAWYCGGCCHELIGKHFPEMKKFLPLHLCTHDGIPIYPIENGIYHFKNSSAEVALNYLRLTKDEFWVLNKEIDSPARFHQKLFTLGIVERWKKEADEFIAFLEEKTGEKWVNPYTPEEERCRLLPLD